MSTHTTSPAIHPAIPSTDTASLQTVQRVRDAVRQRFPAWADQCEPSVNVLTLRAWNRRGYRVKKGEKAIRVNTLLPVWKRDEKTGENVQVGTRPATVCVFALPQVEKKTA